MRFANVLFCALAFHLFRFLFCHFSSKLSAVSFFTLGGNGSVVIAAGELKTSGVITR
jgi:hypothetical protein